MKTAFIHMAYDAVSSIVVIIGGIVILLTGIYIIDVILSIVIALMIFWSSYLVIKEAVLIFLEAVPEGIDFDEVHLAIKSVNKVIDVHDLHIWSISSMETALSCHVNLEKDDLPNSPEVVKQINKIINEKFHIGHGTIQIETVDIDCSDLLCNPHNQEKHD